MPDTLITSRHVKSFFESQLNAFFSRIAFSDMLICVGNREINQINSNVKRNVYLLGKVEELYSLSFVEVKELSV